MPRQNFSEKNTLCMKEVLVRTLGMGFWNTQSLHYHCGSMHHLSLARGRQAWRRWQMMIGLVQTLQLASIIIFILSQLSISIGSPPLRDFGTIHSGPLPLPTTQTLKSSSSQEGSRKVICEPYWNITKIQEIKQYGKRKRKIPSFNMHSLYTYQVATRVQKPTKGSKGRCFPWAFSILPYIPLVLDLPPRPVSIKVVSWSLEERRWEHY